jgi:hypothetical protein
LSIATLIAKVGSDFCSHKKWYFVCLKIGQIKVFNVRTGEAGRTLVVNSNSIIELVTIER